MLWHHTQREENLYATLAKGFLVTADEPRSSNAVPAKAETAAPARALTAWTDRSRRTGTLR